jgi:CRISPR-associated protein Csb1
MNADKFDDLLNSQGPAAIVEQRWLRPAVGEVVFPPTYANPSGKKADPPVYNINTIGDRTLVRLEMTEFTINQKRKIAPVEHERWEEGVSKSTCTIDSVQSQANRIEPIFGRLCDEEGNPIRLVPQVKIKAKAKTSEGEEELQIDLLEDAGHRIADAVIMNTSLHDDIQKAIKARQRGNSWELAKLAPTSLLFGMWDSRDSGAKVPRLFSAMVAGYGVRPLRRSAQFNGAMDFEAAGVSPGDKDKKLSAAGMDSAPATFELGGVIAEGGIRRDASINLCTLRDLQAGDEKQTHLLQQYILGLALLSMTCMDGKALNLRQGCQLVNDSSKKVSRRLVNADGTETDLVLTNDDALAFARAAAEAFGIGKDRIDVEFDPKLAKEALKKSKKDEDGS